MREIIIFAIIAAVIWLAGQGIQQILNDPRYGISIGG